MNPIATLSTKDLKKAIINEANTCTENGQSTKPICALAKRLGNGSRSFSRTIMELIYNAHINGLWVIDSHDKLKIYKDYCEEAGGPIVFKKPILVQHVPVYLGNVNDCILMESPKGARYVVCRDTEKDNLQIAFRHEYFAAEFRKTKSIYSMEATGNQHLKLLNIKLQTGMIETTCYDLYKFDLLHDLSL